MFREKESVLQKSTMLLDAIVLSWAFFIAYYLREHFPEFDKFGFLNYQSFASDNGASLSEYLLVLFIVVPVWCFIFYINGMYRSMRTRRLVEFIWIIFKSFFFAILAFGAIVFIFKLVFISRLYFAIFVLVSLIGIVIEKISLYSIMRYVRRRGHNHRRILIVGTGRRAINIVHKVLYHPEWGLEIIGAIDDEPERGIQMVGPIEVIGGLPDLQDILHDKAIDEVVFVVPRSRLNHIEDAVYICETEGVKATVAVDLFNLKIARSRPSEFEDIPLITFETTLAKEWQLYVKRAMDLIIAGAGLIILSPFLLIIALFIKLGSPGPVMFKQVRLGLNGRRFVLYKFRTMYEEAEKELAQVSIEEFMGDSEFKKKKIQYMTPVGKILRKFSIDELPQLFNVFAGHMSLIGPRPCVPEEVEQYQPWQRRRLSMRPGITCLWQIRGRNNVKFEDWMKLDLEYLDNWSLALDFKILVKTIPVVILGIGAY
jgi:exopolysaccharide biosynthesis polyprenyl glycosylphosphotransferase